MEALPLRTGRTNCVTSMQRDMAEQTLAIIASMMQQAAHDATLYCAEAKRTVIMPRDIEQRRGGSVGGGSGKAAIARPSVASMGGRGGRSGPQ